MARKHHVTLRRRVWEILEVPAPRDRLHRWVAAVTIALISLNVLAVVLGTVGAIHERFARELYVFEAFSVAVFSVEYLVRVCGPAPPMPVTAGRSSAACGTC